jgi:hypothetical protein
MRLFFNMFGAPIAFLIAGYLLLSSGWGLYDNAMFGQLAIYLIYPGYICAAVSLLIMLTNAWKMWRAYQGKGELCDKCSYPTRYVQNGRYGPYFKCWNCGANRAHRC